MESYKCQSHKTKTSSKYLRCKLCKLKHVHNCLSQILHFLKDYLPLANSHSNEFITNNTWENFLPENIRDELSSMSDEHLIDLSSYHKTTLAKRHSQVEKENVEDVLTGHILDEGITSTCLQNCNKQNVETEIQNESYCANNFDCQKCVCGKNCRVVSSSLTNSCATCEDNSGTVHREGHQSPVFSSSYFDQAPKINNKHKLIRGFPPNWVHKDLTSFLGEAESNTLEHFNLALSLKEFYSKLSVPVDEDKIFIPHIMNMKKSHEVDIMGEVCSHLAKNCGTNLVVDMGSGKGYLSTQLALQYNMVVIGIDAMSINTDGAQKRTGKLVKHWNGLVRNATEDKIRGYKVKRSKKLKKKLKREAMRENENESKKDVSSLNSEDRAVSEELPDFQNLFNDNSFAGNIHSHENSVAESNESIIEKNESTFFSSSNEDKDKSSNENIPQEEKEDSIDTWGNIQLEGSAVNESSTQEGQTSQSVSKVDKTYGSEMTTSKLSCKRITKSTEISVADQNEEISEIKRDVMNTKGHENVYPLTMFVSPDLNLGDIVNAAFEEYDETSTKKCDSESGLMLTGLHTCGALGSSILKLFVNNPQAKTLCNVACCYHLMEEEFVCAPFDDGGSNDEEPGFPLSKYLKDRKVGLGRVARNFASQSLIRMAKENQLESKAFPRSLLQKIILDVIGYTKEDWKGLRKLDQKCDNMYQYVYKAFTKLGLPTEKLTPELVTEYEQRFKEEERKLAIFHNLKSMVAPCIEAVVILDRLCYLLEQSNVSDVDLVQLFDPMISPRCYGIIAHKREK